MRAADAAIAGGIRANQIPLCPLGLREVFDFRAQPVSTHACSFFLRAAPRHDEADQNSSQSASGLRAVARADCIRPTIPPRLAAGAAGALAAGTAVTALAGAAAGAEAGRGARGAAALASIRMTPPP